MFDSESCVMENKVEISSESCFTSAMTLAINGDKDIPNRYILPPLQRPYLGDFSLITLPVIDLSLLNDPLCRFQGIYEIRSACKNLGFFQVINHGIPVSMMEDALDVANDFFHLPSVEKMVFASGDVREPVRYGTSVNHITDKVFCWRDFIKHYANPISEWAHLWPVNPPSYRQKMGIYSKAVHILQKEIMGEVMESLGLNGDYLQDNNTDEASQLMVVNYYPSCPKPELALGLHPHSDYGTMTILNQTHQGLEVMDHNRMWHPVPFIHGGLIVQLGDQMEIMSNGRYKSTIHRATVNTNTTRLSIASIHSLPIERKVAPIPNLVNGQHPIAYKEGSFSEFLDHISSNCLSETKYIDTLRIL